MPVPAFLLIGAGSCRRKPRYRNSDASSNGTAPAAPSAIFPLYPAGYYLSSLSTRLSMGKVPQLTERNYNKLFTALLPDISRTDNESLAKAAHMLAQTYQVLGSQLPNSSPTLTKLFTSLILNAGGNPLSEELLEKILQEIYPNNNSK
jgi:hypothetical protein